jgi:hypothetical protein
MTQQASGEHTRIVDGEEIARPEKAWQVGDRAVRDGATRPIEHQQTGLTAWNRGLGDQVVGQREVEV